MLLYKKLLLMTFGTTYVHWQRARTFVFTSAATTSWRYCDCSLDGSLNEQCRPVLATMASDIKNYRSVLGIKGGGEELNEHYALLCMVG